MYWHKHTLPPYEWRKQPELNPRRDALKRWLIILAVVGVILLCCASVVGGYLLLR